jgi:hypothetical protein
MIRAWTPVGMASTISIVYSVFMFGRFEFVNGVFLIEVRRESDLAAVLANPDSVTQLSLCDFCDFFG